jgi:hypothetical protein
MTHFPIEIELPMDGLGTYATRQGLVSITLTLFRALYVPSILMLTCDPVHPKGSTLQISYEYLPDLIEELLT